MKIPLIDRSNYFRGLLLLIRKTERLRNRNPINETNRKTLGFEPSFCENAISSILENKYILMKHPLLHQMKLQKNLLKMDFISLFQMEKFIRMKKNGWGMLQWKLNSNELVSSRRNRNSFKKQCFIQNAHWWFCFIVQNPVSSSV